MYASKITVETHETELISLTDKITDATPSPQVTEILSDSNAKKSLAKILEPEKEVE